MGWLTERLDTAEERGNERRAQEAAELAAATVAGTARLVDLSDRIARKVKTTGAKWKIWKEAWLGSDELEPQWIQLAILGELRAIRHELAELRAVAGQNGTTEKPSP